MSDHVVMVDQLFVFPSSEIQAFAVGSRHGHRWCHMWCEPGDEATLHTLARLVGMRRSWFQDKPGFPHYDLVPSRRRAAIKAEAVETDLAEWLKQRRQSTS